VLAGSALPDKLKQGEKDMTTLRKTSLEEAIQEWFRAAVLPQLPAMVQLGIAFGHRGIGQEVLSRMMQYRDIYKNAGTLDENDNFIIETMEEGLDWLFKDREHIENDFYGTPVKLTKLNLQELLSAARQIESHTQAQ
jgi:hypothetical protein